MSASNLTRFFLNHLESVVNPRDTLFVFDNTKIPFHEVCDKVARLSGGLSRFIRPREVVLLLMKDCPNLVYAFLSVIATGAVPTCLNPRLSTETLLNIITDCAPKLIIFDEDFSGENNAIIRKNHSGCVLVSAVGNHDADANLTDLLNTETPGWNQYFENTADGISFLQYTSGSTGKPKGVGHSASATVAFCEIFARGHLRLSKNDLIYSAPKLFFGYGMGNSLFFPLFCGAPSILEPRWSKPDVVVGNLKKYQPTVFFSVPTLYKMLLGEKVPPELFAKTRILFSAGAPLTPALFDEAKRSWNKSLVDGVGATEIGHVFLSNDIDHPLPVSGKPLSGYEVRLVDDQMENVDKGVQGELLVKGPSVFGGYYNNPSQTGEKFHGAWYKTGDCFKEFPDGNYSYLGRKDDHFKSKGKWVVPIVCENKILDHFKTVSEAVLVPSYSDGDYVPVLYAVCQKQDQETLIRNLRDFCSKNIESHARPQDIFIVSELPKNENGKVKRKELSAELGVSSVPR